MNRYRDLGTKRDKWHFCHSQHPTLPKQMRYQTALHAVCLRYSNLTSILAVKSVPQLSPSFPRGKSLLLGQIRDKKKITADAVLEGGAAVCGAPKGSGASQPEAATLTDLARYSSALLAILLSCLSACSQPNLSPAHVRLSSGEVLTCAERLGWAYGIDLHCDNGRVIHQASNYEVLP